MEIKSNTHTACQFLKLNQKQTKIKSVQHAKNTVLAAIKSHFLWAIKQIYYIESQIFERLIPFCNRVPGSKFKV